MKLSLIDALLVAIWSINGGLIVYIWVLLRRKRARSRSLRQHPSSSQNMYLPPPYQLHPSQNPFANPNWFQQDRDVRPTKQDHPITGYRAFQLYIEGRKWNVLGHTVAVEPYIGAINESFGEWFPGVNVAQHCGKGRHKGERYPPNTMHSGPCPAHGDQCGFWMLRDYYAALTKAAWDVDLRRFPVVGVVQGWGKTIEHGVTNRIEGYRCQYATIIALAMYPYTSKALGSGNDAGITAVAYDFACETLQEIARQFDVIYVDDCRRLIEIKKGLDGEKAKDPA